ncbi:hypothetical protein YM304_37620 [Ilumatobacter coccineus YM16-304]|uniref:DUF2254 domain-containing protein n=1 Tax=Ilumatobacter coccineus (strain NBRC 103263 / KCTC 29153 / YM16-304) TaxID=1313172 RepID=A0A6C7EJC7_ILUCY|nr:hypothetical protein YM304_37620 [Ilumatobacter coccineus YM16-304]
MSSSSTSLKNWLTDRVGLVRARQFLDGLRHSLSFVPGLYVIGSIVVVQSTLFIDRQIGDDTLPVILTTTVDSSRAVLGALAGGLITSITLLLSMMLITIQLASAQFSPRTLRDWLGNRLMQHTVGLALGTTVFSLLALRAARTFGEGTDSTDITPHISVLVALALGVVALFGVVRSVDHVTHSVRIGSVSRRIANETIAVVEARDELDAGQRPGSTPALGVESDAIGDIPDTAGAVEASHAGWIQQIDEDAILDALPAGSTGYVHAPLGAFVPKSAPLIWVDPPPDDELCAQLLEAFATGDSRTMQQDISFGLVQLTDIAVRALSPGVNDPSTASDIIVQIGNVMLSIWSQDEAPSERVDRDRTLIRHRVAHAEHLRRAFDPIRRYGAADPHVMTSLVRELRMLRSESERRALPGPTDPIDQMIRAVDDTADRSLWSQAEHDEFDGLIALG